MTGEMAWIKPNGLDSNGDTWPHHAELARRLGGTLIAFDKYQGPFIELGQSRFWLSEDGNGNVEITRESVPPDHRAIMTAHTSSWNNDAIEAAACTLLLNA